MRLSLRKVVVLTTILVLAAGCSRRGARSPFDRSGRDPRDFNQSRAMQEALIANSQGMRFAAILATVEGGGPGNRVNAPLNCQPWEQNCNAAGSGTGASPQPWEQGPVQTQPGAPAVSQATARGGKILIAQFGSSLGINTNTSLIPTGAQGITSTTSVVLPGIRGTTYDSSGRVNQGSQLTFSSEGSTIFVTSSTNSIWAVPFYEGGSLGDAKRIDVGGPTHEIYAARTPELEIIMAAKNDGTVAIVRLDRVAGATAFPTLLSTGFRIVQSPGRVTSIAASPTGEWWFFGVNRALASAAQAPGGEVYVCHLPTMISQPENRQYAIASQGMARGCYTSIPPEHRNHASYRVFTNELGIGGAYTGFVPYKLAVNPIMAIFVHPMVGPYRLETPDIADMIPARDPYLLPGAVLAKVTQAPNPLPVPSGLTRREFRDVVIHPSASSLIVAMKDTVQTFYMDNYHSQQKAGPLTTIPNGDITALAVDPGSLYSDGTPNFEDGDFALVADAGNRRVWRATLNDLSFGLNVATDGIFIPDGVPLDVAIRTKTSVHAPIAAAPIAAAPGSSTGSPVSTP